MSGELLVFTAEPSGDAIAADIIRALPSDVRAIGWAGPRARRAGLVPLGPPLTDRAAMGVVDVARQLPLLLQIFADLFTGRRPPPRAALLVGSTEASGLLGTLLRRRGVPVVWCAAPQVWAWRPQRVHRYLKAFDELAVLFPFEERLWRDRGASVTFVGHPAVDWAGDRVSRRHGMLVLPGSRPAEVRRLAPLLCEAAGIAARKAGASPPVVWAAPDLGDGPIGALRELARRHDLNLQVATSGLSDAPMARVALCASGTVTLEAALRGIAPVITYRLDTLSYRLGKRMVAVRHIGLPNIVLGSRVFPEIIQHMTVQDVVRAAEPFLDETADARVDAARRALVDALTPENSRNESFGQRMVRILKRWL